MTNMLAFVAGQAVRFGYVNHRGETSIRNVRPVLLRWGTSDYYPDPQWLFKGLDLDKAEFREFAVLKMEALGIDIDNHTALPLLRVVKD